MAVNLIAKGPRFRTAGQLVRDGTFPVSEAVLQNNARRYGIGRMMGRTRLYSDEDINRLYEVLPPCRSGSSNAQNRPIGSCAARSAEYALKRAQALLTESEQNRSGCARYRSNKALSKCVPFHAKPAILYAGVGSAAPCRSQKMVHEAPNRET